VDERGIRSSINIFSKAVAADMISIELLWVILFMRIVIGFLAGVIGLVVGWPGLAALAIGLSGPDHDGGIAMGAFFMLGPVGGIVGLVVGVPIFRKLGLVRLTSMSNGKEQSDVIPAVVQTEVSPTFAV
jgi:hypothetical protein